MQCLSEKSNRKPEFFSGNVLFSKIAEWGMTEVLDDCTPLPAIRVYTVSAQRLTAQNTGAVDVLCWRATATMFIPACQTSEYNKHVRQTDHDAEVGKVCVNAMYCEIQ